MNLKRIAKYYYFKFMRLKGDPQSLAVSVAIGVFIGITPTMPLHTILIIFITVVTRTSTIAALLGSLLVCNPITYVPQYYLSTIVGNVLTPYQLSWTRIKEVLDILLQHPGLYKSLEALVGLGYEAAIVLVVGGIVLALPFTIASYFFSLRLFVQIRQKRSQRHLLN
ncbi:MAG: DUF2062 domain-containing protein [Desulfocapsaceae bacterium]|jgi:uncharacterized protein (DUF2062 family)|nr:DUF2062 domain-containing protein [Desulfocapsaceae bacterium]